MAKEIYIDENGNELLVSGTINNAEMLPITSGSATNTKDYIDSGLSGKEDSLSFGGQAITWNTTNVDGNANIKYYYKYGRVVIAHLEFTPKSGRIANGNVICSGLPLPHTNYNCFGGNQQQMIINANGELVWYFPTDTTTLNRCDLNIAYFSAN